MAGLKNKTLHLLVLVSIFVLALPLTVLAEVTISGTITINIPDAGINLTVSSTTGIDDFTVSGPSVTFTLAASDLVTVVPPSGYTLSNDVGANNNCSDSVTFTETVVVTPVQCSGPTGGGGGGGGGGATKPTNTSIKINSDASQTNNKVVSLSLSASNATKMIISNSSDFVGSDFETFTEKKTWTLSDGFGQKTVYVKFRSSSGGDSSAVFDTIEYIDEPGAEVDITGLSDVPPVSVEAGELIKGTNSASSYFVGGDGKRYIFPSFEIYQTWYGDDFAGLITQSNDDVTIFPLGGNVRVRPGIKLVQAVTNDTPWVVADPKVYAVAAGGVLRHVLEVDVIIELYGADWETKIIPIVETVFTDYDVGSPILTADDFDPLAEAVASTNININRGLPDVNINSNPTAISAGTTTSAAEQQASDLVGSSTEGAVLGVEYEERFVSFLSVGSVGDEVRLLQDVLRQAGYFPTDTASSGFFGSITEEAVKTFQSANDIDSVGYVGPSTRAALNSL